MTATGRRFVRWVFAIAAVASLAACNELTVDDTPRKPLRLDVDISCRVEVPEPDSPGGSFCHMAVGEVDTLKMTLLVDSASVTGLRISWIPVDSTALSIRTMDKVMDSTQIAALNLADSIGLQLRAEVVALKRGSHEWRFVIDSAGIFANEQERDSFNMALRDSPFGVRADERWGAVTAGRDHTCALTYNDRGDTAYTMFDTKIRPGGQAFCWGDALDGALGTGSTNEVRPVALLTDERFGGIAAGSMHTCALDLTLLVLCWGGNERGQLGTGNKLDQFSPRRLALGIPFHLVSLGGEFTCGVPRSLGEQDVPTSTTCWGRNVEGQLGCDDGDPSGPCFDQALDEMDDQVVPSEDVKSAGGDIDFATVAAGARHACGIIEQDFISAGTVWCWGDNNFGQLGVSSAPTCLSETISFPCHRLAVRTQGPGGGGPLTFRTIAAGGDFTCALTDVQPGGQVYCWGRNTDGQLGNGTNVDSDALVQVINDFAANGLSQLTAGGAHACALTSEGAAYCWGSNSDGQLGDGTTVSSAQPVAVAGGFNFVSIAAGAKHTCGVVSSPVSVAASGDIASGGPIYCWGDNETIGEDGLGGKLGNGTTEDSPVPVRIAEPGPTAQNTAGGHADRLRQAPADPFEGMELLIGYRPAVPAVFVGLEARVGM